MNKSTFVSWSELKDPRLWLAFGFGSGKCPKIPGTAGTLVAIPLYLLMLQFSWPIYALSILLSAVIGIYLCHYATKKLGVQDHSGIVWDEFVGLWITFSGVSLVTSVNWQIIMSGFILFRFFDMLKPWPISLADKHIHGGFGVMFDDILAGFAACACLHSLIYVKII